MSTTNSEDAGRRGSGGYVTSGAMSDLREAIQRYAVGPDEGHPGWNEMVPSKSGVWVRIEAVEAYLQEHDARPKLGLATTHELIAELMARADVANAAAVPSAALLNEEIDAIEAAVEAYLREHDAQIVQVAAAHERAERERIRQRIEALTYYGPHIGVKGCLLVSREDVLAALGGTDE